MVSAISSNRRSSTTTTSWGAAHSTMPENLSHEGPDLHEQSLLARRKERFFSGLLHLASNAGHDTAARRYSDHSPEARAPPVSSAMRRSLVVRPAIRQSGTGRSSKGKVNAKILSPWPGLERFALIEAKTHPWSDQLFEATTGWLRSRASEHCASCP